MTLKRYAGPSRGSSRNEPKQSVLYVEDEDVNWEVTEFSLRNKFRLTRARSAVDAFRLLARHEYDLILMDIQLMSSELNGIEITQLLRGLYQGSIPDYARGVGCGKARIIFVTAYSARYGKQELLEAGGDDLITKPVDFTRLSLVMSRLVVREAFAKRAEANPSPNENAEPERRENPRVDYHMECRVECRGYIYRGNISDISLGGARLNLSAIEAGHPLTPKQTCKVEFETAWGKVNADCEVINQHATPSEIGVKFTFLAPASRSIIHSWLNQNT